MYKKSILYTSIFLFAVFFPLASAFSYEQPALATIQESAEERHLQRLEDEAENKARQMNDHYEMGRACYYKGDFLDAIEHFKKSLDAYPGFEPARLYLQCAFIRHKMELQEKQISAIKLKMANIVAEYDARLKDTEGLAFNYILEQALLCCQAGKFKEAEYYFNLCCKLDPQNKEKIKWFADAAYTLEELHDSLDKIYQKIGELFDAEYRSED